MNGALAKRSLHPVFTTPWLAVVGAIATVIAAVGVVFAPGQGYAALLIAGLFGTQLALGAALFIAINAVSGATWWAPLRSVSAALSATLVVPIVPLIIVFSLGMMALYPWAASNAAADPIIAAKAIWLNIPFFLLRAGIVIAVWLAFVAVLRWRVLATVANNDVAAQRRLVGVSAAFLFVYAVTISIASWDWTMSLEPHWSSTMQGVYAFSGSFLGGIAMVTLVGVGLRAGGEAISAEQRHDLGLLLFAFSMFWGYIWFSEYMLTWYANIPEETGHFIRRTAPGWKQLYWLNVVLNFALPWVVLLPVRTKKHIPTLLQVAMVLVVGRWLDCFLAVAPAEDSSPSLPIYAIAASIAVLAGMGLIFGRLLGRDDAP